MISKLTKRIRELANFPEIGGQLSSIINIETNYRFLVRGYYTAFYRFEDKSIYVDRVLYGKRDFMKVLFGDYPSGGLLLEGDEQG